MESKNSHSLLYPESGVGAGDVWVHGEVLAGNSCWSTRSISASSVALEEVHPAPHDTSESTGRLRRTFVTLTTMTGRLPGLRVTHHTKQGTGAAENFIISAPLHSLHMLWRRLPRCPCDLAPRPSASASGLTPPSSAPVSGFPVPTGSTAPGKERCKLC